MEDLKKKVEWIKCPMCRDKMPLTYTQVGMSGNWTEKVFDCDCGVEVIVKNHSAR